MCQDWIETRKPKPRGKPGCTLNYRPAGLTERCGIRDLIQNPGGSFPTGALPTSPPSPDPDVA